MSAMKCASVSSDSSMPTSLATSVTFRSEQMPAAAISHAGSTMTSGAAGETTHKDF